MAKAMAIFALFSFEATPKDRASFPAVHQSPHGQRQGKATGRRKVAIGHRRDVMQASNRQPLLRQVPVKVRQPQGPGGDLPALCAGRDRLPPPFLRTRTRQMLPQPGNERPRLLPLRHGTRKGRFGKCWPGGRRGRIRWRRGRRARSRDRRPRGHRVGTHDRMSRMFCICSVTNPAQSQERSVP
jgi:hypothetical protein